MTQPRDEWSQLDHVEEQFVRRLAAHYAPEPLTPARRVALDEALWARLQRQPRQTRLHTGSRDGRSGSAYHLFELVQPVHAASARWRPKCQHVSYV